MVGHVAGSHVMGVRFSPGPLYMLNVKASVKPSNIHGMGLTADEDIERSIS